MGYPTSYRAARGLQKRALAQMPDLPPFEFGPLAGAAVAAWAFVPLGQMLIANWTQPRYQQDPSFYGWVKTQDCGRQPARLNAAAFLNCSPQIVGRASWENNGARNPLVFNTIWYWAATATYKPNLLRYEDCLPAQKWERMTGTPFVAYTVAPPISDRPPGVLLGGPLRAVFQSIAGGVRDYAVSGVVDPFLGRGFRSRFATELVQREILYPDMPYVRVPPRPVTVPRAIPFPGTFEKKFSDRSRVGRAIFAMYRAFNFLGDSYGFTRAIWRSIQGNARRRTPPLSVMWDQIMAGWSDLDWRAVALNTSLWKLSDTVAGVQQASMFEAQASVYGADAARLWSTLDSSIRYGVNTLRRASRRTDDSTRI